MFNINAPLPKECRNPSTFYDFRTIDCNEACDAARLEATRGKVIIGCGGGKTNIEHYLIENAFKEGAKLQIIVAPTIALLQQLQEKFTKYGLFALHGVKCINFRTGEDLVAEIGTETVQTTSPDKLKETLEQWKSDKILIFCTYDSIKNLLTALNSLGVVPGVTYWDEFHHLISPQTTEQLNFIKNFKGKNLFFSASEKRGKIISSFDEELFGKTLINVTYQELCQLGIVVSKIIVKLISYDQLQSLLSRTMKNFAKLDGVDLQLAHEEAAAMIIAMNDYKKIGIPNMLAFSGSVAVCNFLAANQVFANELPDNTLINAVSAGTSSQDRQEIFDLIRNADERCSILLQHSIVKEGIDLTPFNSLIVQRDMNTITFQQALGRVTRAHPDDTKNLADGEISLDSPAGWIKPSATIYFVVDKVDEAYLNNLLVKLTEAGLGVDDWQFQDTAEPRNGVPPEDTSWMNKPEGSVEFTKETLAEAIERLRMEHVEREAKNAQLERCKGMSILDILDEDIGLEEPANE